MATHKVPERRGKAGQEPPRGPLLSGQESLSRYIHSYWSRAGYLILICQEPPRGPLRSGQESLPRYIHSYWSRATYLILIGQEPPRSPLLSGQESLLRYTYSYWSRAIGTCFLLVKSSHVIPFSVGKRVCLAGFVSWRFFMLEDMKHSSNKRLG